MVKELWPDDYNPRPLLLDDQDYERVNHLYLPVGVQKSYLQGLARKIIGTRAGYHIDHINGDDYDNRRCNLRLCLPEENQRNRRGHRGSSSVYKGVNKHKDKWRARICIKGEHIHIGLFGTESEAGRAYDEAVDRYFPNCTFSYKNFR